MPIDRAARAQQVERIFQHAGDDLFFGALKFQASIGPWQPTETEADRNIGDDTSVLVMTARSLFGAILPVQGDVFRDAANRVYRIQAVRSMPPSHPEIAFICGTVVAPISP